MFSEIHHLYILLAGMAGLSVIIIAGSILKSFLSQCDTHADYKKKDHE